MKKQTTIFILIFLVLCSFAYAAPPTKNIDFGQSGLDIKIPIYNTITTGSAFDFNIHLFNISNGVPIDNTSTTCVLHIYNQSGDHIYGEFMIHEAYSEHFVNNEWVSRLNSSIFSSRGEYNIITQCNNSFLGGHAVENFGVMDNSFDVSNDTTTALSLTVFMISIIIGLLYLGLSKYRLFNLEWTNLLLKRCSTVIAIWLMTYTSAIMTSFALSSNLNITKSMFMYMNLFGWAGYIAMIYLVLKTLFDTLALWRIDKDMKRTGEDE